MASGSAPYDMSAPAPKVGLDQTDNGNRLLIAKFEITSRCVNAHPSGQVISA
jgi:hypothetical protein